MLINTLTVQPHYRGLLDWLALNEAGLRVHDLF